MQDNIKFKTTGSECYQCEWQICKGVIAPDMPEVNRLVLYKGTAHFAYDTIKKCRDRMKAEVDLDFVLYNK